MDKEKLIVVFGESHFITKNGLLKGLENRKTKILNLALGGTSTLQSIYELKRYYEKIKEADLIIIGSNTCDCMHYHYYKTNFVRDIEWFYKELYDLNTRILCIINPTFQDRLNLSLVAAVINTHKKNCLKYGFNCIDLHGYYYEKELVDFHREKDGEHDFSFIMRELGKNIINNLNYLIKPINNIKFNNKNPNFYICKRNDFSIFKEINSLLVIQKQNSLYDEEILNLKNNMLLKIIGYENCTLLGIHYWGMEGTIVFEKENSKNYLSFHTIHNHFRDLSNFDIKISDDLNVYMKDSSSIGLISFLLVEDFKNFFITFEDILYLSKQDVVIPNKYNFNHLIPPICLYKEIINEYCSIVIPRKLEKIQIQLSEASNRLYRIELDKNKLSFQAKYGTAKSRIQNQLSYKLGQAMIVNSKSILGYMRMPFVLSYIKDQHTQEQKIYQEKIKKDPSLKLPPLESYPDYQEALKEKECLTYKLGQALIEANKTWYGGGYIKLLFEVRKLKKGN